MRRTRENLSGGKVKGGMVKAHLDWAKNKFGAGADVQVIAGLPPEQANEARSILPTSWCSFATLIAIDRQMYKLFGGGKGEDAFIRHLGRQSAEQNLSTTYRLYALGDVHAYFTRSANLHRQFQDFGTARYEKLTEKSSRMHHEGYTAFSPVFCASALGYYEGVLAVHHSDALKIEETSCTCAGDDHCIFEMSWT